MEDLNVIIICSTVIVITFFIYMIFNHKGGGHIEFDTKTGKLLLKTLNEDNNEDNKDKEDPKANDIKDKKVFNKNDSITELKIYKDFTLIINDATLKIFSDCIFFLVKNNITKKSQYEYNKYFAEKIKLFTNYYDESLKNSVNKYLRQINIKYVLGIYNHISKTEFKNFYINVYNNHLELDKKNKENLEYLITKEGTEQVKLALLQASIINNYNEIIYNDTRLLREALDNFNNILLNLFYDRLKSIIEIEEEEK